MFSTSLRRKVVFVLLFAILAVPWPSVAEARELNNPVDLFGRVWSFLKAVWSETGCHIDPSGGCVGSNGEETLPADQMDEGCHIDPDGRCSS